MKRILILVFIIELAFTLNSQSQWIKATNGLNDLGAITFYVKGNTIYAGTWDGLYISTDFGDSWQQQGLPYEGVLSISSNSTNLFATTLMDGIFLSPLSGGEWIEINGGLKEKYAGVICAGASDIYAGTPQDGVYRSTNNGLLWTQTNLTDSYINSILISGNNVFATASGFGVYLSQDNGETWVEKNEGLTSMSILSLIQNGSDLIAGTNSKGVFISTNNGDSWEPKSNGLTQIQVNSIAAVGNKLFAGTYDGGVFYSKDNGENWVVQNNGLSDLKILAVAVCGEYVFAGTTDIVFRAKLSDFGNTEVNNSFTSQNFDISISPNPSSDKVLISSSEDIDNANIKITNIEGTELISRNSAYLTPNNPMEIEIKGFPKGVYFCTLNTTKSLITKKFIVVK